jgi:hypothetical protein
VPRISLWKDGKRTDDFKFFDKVINEQFTMGATDIYIHKYLGPQNNNKQLVTTTSQNAIGTSLTFTDISTINVSQFVFGIGIASDTKVGVKTSNTINLTKSTTSIIPIGTTIWFSDINDSTLPNYLNQSAQNIQDLLLLENRDRKYDSSIYTLRGSYQVQDLDFNLSQFGIFLTNDTLFLTFHLNTMVQQIGRKLMSGDVLELPHLKDFYSLDETVPVALKRFYVIQDAMKSANGYSPTWWPHLWRVKCIPLVDSQEYKQILSQIQSGTNSTLSELLGIGNTQLNINNAVIAEAEKNVPLSGYDTSSMWIPPMSQGINNLPIPSLATEDSLTLVDENGMSILDTTENVPIGTPLRPTDSPDEIISGYLVGDGRSPNDYYSTSGTSFPSSPTKGDFFLRLDFLPNRLFKFNGVHWIKCSDSVRTELTPGHGQTQISTFINNNDTFIADDGIVQKSKQALSKLLKPESDY